MERRSRNTLIIIIIIIVVVVVVAVVVVVVIIICKFYLDVAARTCGSTYGRSVPEIH